MLFLLEGFGGLQSRETPDENRMGIRRQPARDVIVKFGQIKPIVDHDRSHSGAAVGAWNFNAIGRGIGHSGAIQYRFVHFGGRDILALPAEGIADPIDKVEIATCIEPHQIAGAKPGIARRQHIAQDFLFGLVSIGVALETAAAIVGGTDAADGFADLASRAGNTKTVRSANGNAKLEVEAHDRRRKTMGQERRDSADRAGLALDVVKREIAFGRRIELEYSRNRKARLKGFPDIATQTIAAREPKPVDAFIFRWG